jgi:hypothetical protein
MQSLSLSLSDPPFESAAMALCAAGGEEASVEILGYSTELTPPQFQLFGLVVLGVVLVIVAFTIVLVAPSPAGPARARLLSSRESASAFPPSTETMIANGDGTDTQGPSIKRAETESERMDDQR